MEQQFKYDAFISYRHAELDKFVAENLHKQLESFHLPKNVVKKINGRKTKIERVFRDKEELPLTNNLEEPILEALESSEWLIVICSPRLRESLWCKKEIETFVALRGREHVLAVLIEGEPAESFPDELLYELREERQPDGTVKQVQVEIEPLAADVRGKNKKEVKKAMKIEMLRVLAAMFRVPFDDLRQRHKERKLRRVAAMSLIGGLVCLLFGVYSTVTALRIKEQKEQIEVQSAQILEQSDEIQKKSDEILAQNEEITKKNEEITKQNETLALHRAKTLAESAQQYLQDGNRELAIRYAAEALTESDGIAMPYTAEAQFALTESLCLYDTEEVYRANYQVETLGRIEDMKESPDAKTLAIYDDTGTLTLFDLERREEIVSWGAEEINSVTSASCAFIGEHKFAFVDRNSAIKVYDLQTKRFVKTLDAQKFSYVLADPEGSCFVTDEWINMLGIYDGDTLELLGTIKKPIESFFRSKMILCSDGILVSSYERAEEKTQFTLAFTNLNTRQSMFSYDMGTKTITDVKVRNGVAYVLSSDYGEGYTSNAACLTAFSLEDGAVLWERMQSGDYAVKVEISPYEEATEVLFVTNNIAQMVDAKTGEVSFSLAINSPVIEVQTYTDNNNFLLFFASGKTSLISQEFKLCVDISDRFDCKTTENTQVFYSSYGFTVLAGHDDKITVYTRQKGPGVEESEMVIDFPESETTITAAQAVEMARSYGLERPEFLQTLYYSPDGKLCMARYWDGTLVIYDVEEERVRNTIENAEATYWCLGTDNGSYTYLLGHTGCYILDRDMKPVAWVNDARNVDLINRKIYMESSDIYYEAPIYGLEELLQMAEEICSANEN